MACDLIKTPLEVPAFGTSGEGIRKHKQGEGARPQSHGGSGVWGGLQSLSLLGVQKLLPFSCRLLGSRSEPQLTQAINQMHKMWLGSYPSEKDLGV